MKRRLEVRKMMAAQLYMRECTEQENNPHENSENSLPRRSQRPPYSKKFKRRKINRKRKTNVKSVAGEENTYVACRSNKISNLMYPGKTVNLVGEGRLNNTNLEKERRNRNLRKRNVNVVVKSASGKENTHVLYCSNKILNHIDSTKKVELIDDKPYYSKNTNVDAHSKQRVRTRKR